MTPKHRAWLPALRHIAAAVTGIAIFGLVYAFSGDSELLPAVMGSLGGGLLVHMMAHLSDTTRERE
jgi:hypothetical protein